MSLGDIFRVDYEMNSDDRRVSVSQYYEETLASTSDKAEVTEEIGGLSEAAFWTEFWQGFASKDLTYAETRTQQIYPTREAPFISDVLLDTAGEVLTDAMNGTTAVLVGQYGELWSRNFQGRMYLPGLPEADAKSGRILASVHSLIQTSNDIFQEQVLTAQAPVDGEWSPVVFSPTLAKADPVVPPVASLMGVTPVRPRIATQRRRRTNVQSTI